MLSGACAWPTGLAPAAGSATSGRLALASMSTPTVSSGAVTMKMMSSTSITSTMGVTLISLIGSLERRRAHISALRQGLIELIQRLAGPEHLLELVGLLARLGEQEELLDDDRPAPHRGREQADNDELDDDMGVQKELQNRQIDGNIRRAHSRPHDMRGRSPAPGIAGARLQPTQSPGCIPLCYVQHA